MPDSKLTTRRKFFGLVGAIVFATIYFFASERMVIKIKQLDVHTGGIRVETRDYWGRVTYESRKPWRETDFKNLFPNAGEARWLPVHKSEHRVLPDLSRSGRRRARRDDPYDFLNSGSTFIRVNLAQVLNAPHISDSTRRDLIYLSFNEEDPNEPNSNFHVLDQLRWEVLKATAYPEPKRKEWQERLERDDGGDIIAFLKEAAQYPALISENE